MSTVAASAHAYLQQLARTVKRPIMWAFCFGLIKTAVIVIQLAIVASLAHELFVHGRGLSSLLHLFIWLVVFSFARAGIGLLQNACLRLATQTASHHARTRLLTRWRRQIDGGAQLSAADGALQLEPIESLKGYFSRYLVQQYLVFASPLLILIVCFSLNPVVGGLLLLSGPIIPLFMALVGMGAERLSQKHAEQTFALSRTFTDKLRNVITLKLFNAGDAALQDVAEAGEGYRKATLSTLKVAFLSSAVLEFFSSVAIAGVALYVGFGLLGYIDWLGADELTLFSGLLVLLLAPEYFAPLRQFAQSYHDRAAAIGAATLLCDPQQAPSSDGQPAVNTGLPEGLSFRWQNLSVTLAEGKRITYGDGEIAKGSLCAISGHSGSGKTTLLRVLLKQMPYQGNLICTTEMSRGVAYFAQQPFLIAGSLRDNINLFERHSDDTIIEGLRQVGLGYLLTSLPEGLAAKLGEKGRGLSGGEQRRIALLRCVLSERRIVIADEPTENLDDVSAEVICDCLVDLAATGKTVIVATHDPKLLARATHVIEVTA